ncbi:TPA: hypothetical protein DEG21_03625 [Patescibacteria group bacterium]|nr:hypothetical protein [Candidatus Gracilibacteria bacterium]HBY74944.1 hypothetical protein [Candidatus Gracilibacteria bacterium]
MISLIFLPAWRELINQDIFSSQRCFTSSSYAYFFISSHTITTLSIFEFIILLASCKWSFFDSSHNSLISHKNNIL